jgi:hypothetical protein
LDPIRSLRVTLQGALSGDRAAPTADGPNALDWVPLGEHACGLVHGGRVVAVVYWQDARSDGEDEHAGFWWVPADLPVDHFSLFAAPSPADADWARARARAADAYVAWAPREAAYTEDLRREAAALLGRARLRQKAGAREEPLRAPSPPPRHKDG